MRFYVMLNEYIDKLGCKAKDVSENSGISAATLSRYRSGERLPDVNSEAFEKLCAAIAQIAKQKKCSDITEASVRKCFLEAEDFLSADTEQLLKNFDTLVSTLNISINKLCRHINYDASTVFRFRNGTRKPADPKKFAADVAGYVVRELDSTQDQAVLAKLLGCSENDLSDSSTRFDKLTEWLLSGKNTENNPISDFLLKLDEFDLNDYIKAIHFDELKVPSVPFQMPTSKTYFGLNDMMASELDFLKATVLSKSMEPVTMYSDMPMEEMAKDSEFPKKWMYGMAMMLKKGLHLNQIHNLDRSFEDMMLGLESWIPMYMTGQISPYYLKKSQNNVFLHFLKVSGAAALSGEAIAGYQSDGKYYLTKSKKEVEYYAKRAQELLNNAYPLMDIYRSENRNELQAFLLSDSKESGKRRSILSTLPLYTMEEPLLKSVLERHGFTGEEMQSILETAAISRQWAENILETESIEDEVFDITKEEFAAHPLTIDLSGAFCEKNIPYTYEEYCAHLKSTERFAANHPNYTLKKTASQAFRNLQISIHEGKWAMVSKGRAPVIHFVIHHPKLRNAIENFIPPVVEKN
ncbi:MAG: helix-turn-helix domain-containing protein [Acutalibacteraceae bacterium]